MYTIKKQTIGALLEAARNTYPNEFFALLGGDRARKIIDEFVVVPAIYGKRHTLVKTDLIPFDSRILGTVHSHPSRSGRPSQADLGSFRRMGEIHLIISYPFTIKDVSAFDSAGGGQDVKIAQG